VVFFFFRFSVKIVMSSVIFHQPPIVARAKNTGGAAARYCPTPSATPDFGYVQAFM
jgi:hypothetical protein